MLIRTVAKISGEYFHDLDKLKNFMSQICAQSVIGNAFMCGGGNIIRGGRSDIDMPRNCIDHVGMMSTVMNSMYLSSILEGLNISTKILTPTNQYACTQIYNSITAMNLLKSHVVILAGGLGCGYISTDTALVIRSLELNCIPIKITQVGGVYSSDPLQDKDARLMRTISYQDAIQTKALDACAVAIAMEHDQPIIYTDIHNYINLQKMKCTSIDDICSNDNFQGTIIMNHTDS